jgi:hypothetical protein
VTRTNDIQPAGSAVGIESVLLTLLLIAKQLWVVQPALLSHGHARAALLTHARPCARNSCYPWILEEMERVMGIEPTTFSLGSGSGSTLTDADRRGHEQASEVKTTSSGETEGSTCDCHPDS